MSHFNKEAANWDDPEKIALMKKLAEGTLKHLRLQRKLDILDFGCGTGLFGLELADFAKTLTGVDTSEGMLAVFDKKTNGRDQITSINVDLETQDLEMQFDLIVSSMAFHHLDAPSAMLGKLKTMLRKGGTIAIVDLDEEDGSFHPNNEEMGVRHYGFAKPTVQKWAAENHLSIDHSIIFEMNKNDKSYKMFLAVLQHSPTI